MTRAFHFILAALMLAALAGCFGSAPPVPKEQYFRLIAAAPETSMATPFEGAIEVSPFAAEGVLAERPLLFTGNDGRKLEQRNYAYWTDAPPQMLRDQVIAYLRAGGAAGDVVQTELRVPARYQVKGVLRRLEQKVGAAPGAVIAIDLSVIEKESDRLVLSRRYEADKPTPDETIDAAADALNAGLDDILARFLADLGQAR